MGQRLILKRMKMDNKEEKDTKTIYPSPVDFLVDDGDYIVIDKYMTNSVSFIEGVDSLRIPKNYLADCLRSRFQNEVEQEHEAEFDLAFLDDLTEEIIGFFDKELNHFMELWGEPIWNLYRDFVNDDVIKSYISYVLKSELYKEYMRINYVIQAIEEPEGSKEYYQKLKDCVFYPEKGAKVIAVHDIKIKAENDELFKRWNLEKAKIQEQDKKDDAEQ